MKLNNLQTLRAIAAYMVLLAHLEDVERKYGQGRLLGEWADLGVWGVDLFFVLSGFVMVMISGDALGSARAAGRFLWSRASRIYPLWWLCLSALVPIWLVKPEYVYGGYQTEINFFKDYLLIPKTESPLLQTGWTLVHEMYFYIVFAVLLLLPMDGRRRLMGIGLWGLVALSAGIALSPVKGEAPMLALVTHPMTLEFVAGAFCAYLWKASRGAFGLTALIAGALLLLPSLYVAKYGLMYQVTGSALSQDWIRVILFLPSAALLTYGAASVELRRGWRARGLPVWLGDWSYSLYLTHMLTLNAFGLVWSKIAVPGLVDNVFGLAGITLGCTVVAALCYRFFELPLLDKARQAADRWFPEEAKAEESRDRRATRAEAR